jgi:hypothetical protein
MSPGMNTSARSNQMPAEAEVVMQKEPPAEMPHLTPCDSLMYEAHSTTGVHEEPD